MAEAERWILEVTQATGPGTPAWVATAPVDLRLAPGELAMIDVRDERRSAWFADLCSGLIPLTSGSVRFLGRDWAEMPPHYAAALRGRIGRVFGRGGWIEFADMATNILLPQLHHTRRDEDELREAAALLARDFGLPGLPTGPVSELSEVDRARAACVRAFVGRPTLLLLESPVRGRFADLKDALLNALAGARAQGAAAIWLAGSDLVWDDRSVPATQRLRLRDEGLRGTRQAA